MSPLTHEDLTAKYMALDERVTRHTEQLKTCFSRIEDIKAMVDSVQKLAVTVELLAHEQKDIGKKVDKISGEIEEIKERPAKRWESVVSVIITAVATAVVTYVLTRVGLK